MKQTCKIANSEEGMDKLFEHTLQRQTADQTAREVERDEKLDKQSEEIGALKNQIAELTTLIKNGVIGSSTNSNNNNNNNINIGNTTNTTININPWGRDIYISVQMLEATFAENETMQRYCRIGLEGRTNPEEAVPYVQEALMDLVKRVHRDPQQKNVHLNPKRHDQVLIFDEATWQVLPLVEAIRSLFDRVASGIRKTTSPLCGKDWQKLSSKVQESAPWLPIMYDQDRERHITRAKTSMAAHLANMVPGKALPAPPQVVPGKALPAPPQVVPVDEESQKPEPETTARPIPAKPAEQEPPSKKSTSIPPKPFTADDAAALFRATKARRGEGRAAYVKRLFEGAKEQDPGRIMAKLWEAADDGGLSDSEAAQARELVTEYDRGTFA